MLTGHKKANKQKQTVFLEISSPVWAGLGVCHDLNATLAAMYEGTDCVKNYFFLL